MSENYIIKIPKKHLIFYCCQTPGQKKVLICLPSMTALGTETRGILIRRVFVFQQIPVPVSPVCNVEPVRGERHHYHHEPRQPSGDIQKIPLPNPLDFWEICHIVHIFF